MQELHCRKSGRLCIALHCQKGDSTRLAALRRADWRWGVDMVSPCGVDLWACSRVAGLDMDGCMSDQDERCGRTRRLAAGWGGSVSGGRPA